MASTKSGRPSLVSGPLLNLQVDDVNGVTFYSYGAGTLALTLTVDDEHGNPVEGTFLGTTLPFSFVVCEGCDSLFGGGLSDDFEIMLGEGLFDAAVAKALGVNRHTSGGFIDFGLEAIDGDPDSESRRGFDHRGFAALEIDAVEAPEPAMLVLGLVAAAGWPRADAGAQVDPLPALLAGREVLHQRRHLRLPVRNEPNPGMLAPASISSGAEIQSCSHLASRSRPALVRSGAPALPSPSIMWHDAQ